MTLEIRKANRADLPALLEFIYEKEPVLDGEIQDRFDEILCQSRHSILLGLIDGKIAATLCESVIDGFGKGFPFAVLSGAKIKKEYEKIGLQKAMINKAEYIAAENGCVSITDNTVQ